MDAVVAHFLLQQHHILPGEAERLRREEPGQYYFIAASCSVAAENEKKRRKGAGKGRGARG